MLSWYCRRRVAEVGSRGVTWVSRTQRNCGSESNRHGGGKDDVEEGKRRKSFGHVNQEYIHENDHPDCWDPLYGKASAGSVSSEKKKDGPLFVFLEGPEAVGKGGMLRRLEGMGYRCRLEEEPAKFWSFAYRTSPQSPSLRSLHAAEWHGRLLSSLREERLRALEGEKPKENIVFLYRSPLSGAIYLKDGLQQYYVDQLHHLRTEYNVRVIYCISDVLRVLERVLGKQWRSDEELYEQSFIEDEHTIYQGRYDSMKKHFDTTLHSTSEKQGAAALLHLLGVEPPKFSFPPPGRK